MIGKKIFYYDFNRQINTLYSPKLNFNYKTFDNKFKMQLIGTGLKYQYLPRNKFFEIYGTDKIKTTDIQSYTQDLAFWGNNAEEKLGSAGQYSKNKNRTTQMIFDPSWIKITSTSPSASPADINKYVAGALNTQDIKIFKFNSGHFKLKVLKATSTGSEFGNFKETLQTYSDTMFKEGDDLFKKNVAIFTGGFFTTSSTGPIKPVGPAKYTDSDTNVSDVYDPGKTWDNRFSAVSPDYEDNTGVLVSKYIPGTGSTFEILKYKDFVKKILYAFFCT